jgi:hypothetical protein
MFTLPRPFRQRDQVEEQEVYLGRYTAEMPDDFVVFLIGMRVNRLRNFRRWRPIVRAMPEMRRWLLDHPEAGLLGWQSAWIQGPAVVQYWRSIEDLNRFAHSAQQPHIPAWKAFNQFVRASGDVGIWHETYQVDAGDYECMYGNMPRFGLATASRHVPLGFSAPRDLAVAAAP